MNKDVKKYQFYSRNAVFSLCKITIAVYFRTVFLRGKAIRVNHMIVCEDSSQIRIYLLYMIFIDL